MQTSLRLVRPSFGNGESRGELLAVLVSTVFVFCLWESGGKEACAHQSGDTAPSLESHGLLQWQCFKFIQPLPSFNTHGYYKSTPLAQDTLIHLSGLRMTTLSDPAPPRQSVSERPSNAPAGPIPIFDYHLRMINDSYLSFFAERMQIEAA